MNYFIVIGFVVVMLAVQVWVVRSERKRMKEKMKEMNRVRDL